MIASVKLPNDDAQVDASRYDNDRGGMPTTFYMCTCVYLWLFCEIHIIVLHTTAHII